MERTELSRYLIITWGSESTCQRPKLLLLRIVLHLLPEISGQWRYHNLSHTSHWGSEKSQHSKQKTLNRYFSGSGTISLLQGSLISNRFPKVIRSRRPPFRKRYQIIQGPQDLIIRERLLGLTLITWDSREKNLSNWLYSHSKTVIEGQGEIERGHWRRNTLRQQTDRWIGHHPLEINKGKERQPHLLLKIGYLKYLI